MRLSSYKEVIEENASASCTMCLVLYKPLQHPIMQTDVSSLTQDQFEKRIVFEVYLDEKVLIILYNCLNKMLHNLSIRLSTIDALVFFRKETFLFD